MPSFSHTKHLPTIIAVALNAAFSQGAVAAESPPPAINFINNTANNQDIFTFDYGIPSSPALTLAGLATDTSTTSTSLKPFVIALPGLFASGSTQSTATLDAAVAWIFGPIKHPANYADPAGYWNRLGYRTRLGVALYKGDDGGGDAAKMKGSRLAFGLSSSLADESDPLATTVRGSNETVWDKCLNDNVEPFKKFYDSSFETIKWNNLEATFVRLATMAMPSQMEADSAIAAANAQGLVLSDSVGQTLHDKLVAYRLEITKKVTEAENKDASAPAAAARDKEALAVIEKCKKEASVAAQHGADLDIGVGAVWRGTAGKLQNFKNPTEAIWLAGRIPLTWFSNNASPCEASSGMTSEFSCWMIGGSGRYANDEFVATGDKTTPEIKARVSNAWLTLERLDSRFKLAASYGYLEQRASEDKNATFSKSGWRYLVSFGVSLDSIVTGLWLQGSYGAARGTVDTLDDNVALLSLTFAPPSVQSLVGK